MTKAKILIVEDEPLSAMLLKKAVEKLGHVPVGIARTGVEALETVEREKPDIVLMDIQLIGDMDGVETAVEIKKKADLPIMFITSHTESAILDRAKKVEPVGYLVKPFQPQELKAILELSFYRAAMERERRELNMKLADALEEKERLVVELERSIQEIRHLSGLLPICSSCKKIKDDQGQWVGLENFIQERSEAKFSHGYCPECAQRLHPDLYESIIRHEGSADKKDS